MGRPNLCTTLVYWPLRLHTSLCGIISFISIFYELKIQSKQECDNFSKSQFRRSMFMSGVSSCIEIKTKTVPQNVPRNGFPLTAGIRRKPRRNRRQLPRNTISESGGIFAVWASEECTLSRNRVGNKIYYWHWNQNGIKYKYRSAEQYLILIPFLFQYNLTHIVNVSSLMKISTWTAMQPFRRTLVLFSSPRESRFQGR